MPLERRRPATRGVLPDMVPADAIHSSLVWLETGRHFIDCSALPRWEYLTVIPLQQVARNPASVMPGMTRLLIFEERNDPQFQDYVAGHLARIDRALRGVEPGRE
jgi:hypothetical protein